MREAAEMCGVKKWEFPEVLADFDVSYFQYSYQDVIDDVERLSKH